MSVFNLNPLPVPRFHEDKFHEDKIFYNGTNYSPLGRGKGWVPWAWNLSEYFTNYRLTHPLYPLPRGDFLTQINIGEVHVKRYQKIRFGFIAIWRISL